MDRRQRTLLVVAAVGLGALYWFWYRPRATTKKIQAQTQQLAQTQYNDQMFAQMMTDAETGYGSNNFTGPMFVYGNAGPEQDPITGTSTGIASTNLPTATTPLQAAGVMASTYNAGA